MSHIIGNGWAEEGCGHGWVYPNPAGVVAKCGGPHVCTRCAEDLKARAEEIPIHRLRLRNAEATVARLRLTLDDLVRLTDPAGP